MMMFDEDGQVQQYSVILSKRSHEHLGQLRNISSLVSKINLSSANEISFIVYKYTDKERYLNAETNDEKLKYSEPLWDEITDFKYVFIPELREYYEIAVECNDEESLYKSVTGTSACECELAQSKIYGLEINSETDIARTDYTTPTVFYDKLNPKSSLLHRVLSKLPQYSIEYVDTSLMKLQRTFSVDDEDVYSFLTSTVAEEIGCLFTFDSVKRSISVYDLKTVCLDCGHRGEFSDECPKCKSKNLKFFGKDTTVYIDTENLSSSITSSVDVDKVKNCFKLVTGDDAMTAAVKNCNPNGSSYIYYFSEDQKHEMPNELVEKIESYDKLVESYTEPYQKVMKDMYEAIDKIIYYTSGMMPERKNDETDAKKEASKLTESAMSPLGLSKLNQYTSLATVNSAMKSYAKVFIKSGYFKAEPNESKFEYEGEDLEGVCYGYWYGNFKVTNYSDEEDTAISPTVKIKVTDLYHTFLEQKIDKKLATTTDEEGSIYDVLKLKDLEKFKEALKLYCLNRLKSFYDAIQGAIDIMIEEDQANENADLYKELYVPYHDKLVACQDEMDKRNATIDEWEKTLDKTEAEQKRIQGILNFEKYLGENMYKVFCTYKREDTYQNDNYISDGFKNDEIFERANEFLDAAKEELYKSGEHQRTVSGSLIDFMTMKEFAPLLDNFKIGNFIRIGTDEKIYRLRLVSYQISFDDMSNIDVEFSDVTKIKTGYSDLQSILDKTKSIASSYDAVAHQARSSKKQADVVKNWVQTGLDTTLTKIVNNADNQNITMGDTGLLARRKDDFEDKYEDCQLKLLSTGLYVTDDSWRSVKTAIGKSYFTNPETGKQEMMYGVNAETLVGQMILGNQLGIYSSDGSSQMRFDNFGLVLNALDNGSGHYRRILDIQKDGVSQMYVDSDGNIVLATKQQIETTESIGRLNALYADIEKLYVSNATIEKLLAKYATIENLEAVKATIKDLDVGTLKADFAEIKKLIATDAEIGNLKADNVTIAGLLKANSAEIENLKSVKVSVGELEAYKITVNKLFSAYASIEYLESKYIDADTIKANYVKTAELDATVANINTLKANLAKVETLVAEKADIKDLNAVNANIDTINANLANINKLVAEKATIKDLTATNAKIDNLITNDIKAINATIDNIKANYVTTEILNAKVATINNLIAEKATIQDLNAAKADIGSLNAQVGNIGSILSGNIGTGTLQTIHLTAENLVVDEAVIKDLIASKIGVSDLKAGNISTDKFTIKSNDGGLQIVGSTQQFVDKNGNVRLQIGKDAKGNFSFIVVGEDGKTALYDQNGIKAKGIPDGLIVDKMVADNANIQASKVKYIDKDGNTTLQTVIDNQQGKINSLIKETTIDNGDGTTTSLKDSYNQTVQTVKGNTTTISDIKTSVNEVSGKVTSMDARVTKVEQTADGIKTTVTANKDKWDKASSNASNAVSIAGTANSNASNALNKVNNLEQRASNGEFDGRGVKSTKVEYQASTSGTTAPSGTWSSTVPTITSGLYLWTRTTITYTSGEPSVGYSVARMGIDGAKGETGETGASGTSVTVKSTAVSYGVSSSASTKPSSFSPTMPTVAQGQYLWTKTVVTYSDGKSTETFTYALQGVNGAKGDKGASGKDGVTYYTWIKYADSPTSGMSDSPTNKKYMGIATNKTSSAESTNYSDYTWSLIKGDKGDTGDKGNTGATGNGIASITYTYARTTTQTAPSASSVTLTTMPKLDTTNKYLWQKEIITYTNGQTQTNVVLIAVYGDKGQTGAKGDDGKSPTVSVSKSGATTTITVINTDGSKTIQTVNDGTNGTPGKDGATGKTSYFHVKYSNDGGKTFTANNGETVGDYLGTYTDFVEADSNSVSVYTWVKIKGNTGATGAKGETGSDGKGISSIVHHYLVTNVTTGVTPSTSGWKDTPQSVTSTNKYLWYYQTINYTTGSPTNTTPAIIGVYGDTGGKGAAGKGITSVTPQYYLSNSNTTQTGGTWKTSQDAWSSGKYYWTRDSILWSDGTTTTTTPMLATALNNANSVANNAQTIANQTADKFTWIVKSGTNSTNFTLTDRTAQLVSDEINLKGLVKFSGLTPSTQKSLSEGKCLFPDLTFSIGTNNVEKYCNANTATYPNAVKVERIDRQSDTPTSSKHCMKVTLGTGSFTASCGFVQSVDSRANAVFVQRFIAKLPVGYEFVKASNSIGTGSNDEFISSTKGTGNYEEYVRVIKCGSEGTFNNGGYVYVRAVNSSSATPTDNNPVVFYIASCTTYDITESSDYNAWGMDEIPDIDVTLINGGMIKTKSISTSQLNTHEILAQNGTFMNAINAQEINADRITSGKITSKRIDAYGLSILDKDRNIETFSIASDGQVTLRGSVESYDYISGKTGWSISYKGSAEFNDVTVRGGLITGDGGIASSGGLGVNLQKNTSFYNGLNDWTVSSNVWSVDKSMQYNGINSLRYSASNLSAETISSCTTQAKSISAKSGDTFTAQATFYTDNLSGITGTKPKFKIIFYNTAGTVLHEEEVTVSFINKQWVLTKITATAPANTVYVGISFVGYLNGTFYISQPKIEKGNSATEWSLSPNDKGQVPRFWAGTTYENREYAPFIVYNDGSLKAAKGTFGGVFTGDIKIGNVSITDPNISNGDDATITVINGNTGVKAVQLTDMSQSSFAQNISITDNFYNEQVRINQNGIVNALNQFVVGNIDGTGNERSILTKSYLQFKGGSIVSSDKRLTVERADSFDVGSVSNNTNLTVYGVGEFKKVLKITKELNFNDTVKCIVSDRGIDFNFYDNSQTREKE